MKKIRFVLFLWFLLALLISGGGVSASPPSAETQPALSGITNPTLESVNSPDFTGCGGINVPVVNAAYEQEVVFLVNQERAKNGLPPLKRSIELEEASRYHAADLAQDAYFEHDSYDRAGDDLVYVCSTWDRIKTYYPSPSAENIAGGYATPNSVMNGWMISTGHRNNILSAYSWEIGVGYFQGGGYGSYWVQDFGRQSGVYPLIINQEAESTDSRSVSLYIYGDWTEIRLRNDDGEWSQWMPFQNNLNWELAGGVGTHTVWAEMRNGLETTSFHDTITLTQDDDTPTPTPTPTRTPTDFDEFIFLPQLIKQSH
jgi:uncharacterized protein YkwD